MLDVKKNFFCLESGKTGGNCPEVLWKLYSWKCSRLDGILWYPEQPDLESGIPDCGRKAGTQ